MASISEQRLKEMEAEMNRFEQEIAPTPQDVDLRVGSGMIIGSSTFDQIQAQLRQIRQETSSGNLVPPPPPPPILTQAPSAPSAPNLDLPLSALAPPPPPPPPPPPEPTQDQSHFNQQLNETVSILPPPPPPPPLINRPAFVPPQLRQRPFSRPPMHPMSHHGFHGHGGPMGHPMGMHGPMGPGPYLQQQMMGPPQPGPMGYHSGPYPQHYPMMGGDGMSVDGMTGMVEENQSGSVSEEKPKVIYSAPPVRTVPKSVSVSTKKGKSGKTEKNMPGDAVGSSDSTGVPSGEGRFDSDGMGHHLQEDRSVADMELDVEVTAPTKRERKERKKKFVRTAAGVVWDDPTLAEWDQDDFRMFCGDLGNEVTDEVLTRAFSKYPTFQKAKVVRDRRSNKTKGFGFVSFKDPIDFSRAMREMNGKYVGNRPIKLRKSTWKDRSIDIVRKKEKEKKRLGLR